MAKRHTNPQDREFWLPTPVWPTFADQKSCTAPLVYLDLKDWIGLAKVIRGSGDEAYAQLLPALTLASATGQLQVVMTSALHREMMKIKDPKQRTALSEVADQLPDRGYLPGLPDIFAVELHTALDLMTGRKVDGITPFPLVGTSILHSHGLRGGVRIMSGDQDVTERFRAEHPERLRRIETKAERELIIGPSDQDIPALRATGYRPEIAEASAPSNANFEIAWGVQARTYTPNRVPRDWVIARHLCLELIDRLQEELLSRDLKFSDIVYDRPSAIRLALSMPSSATLISLITQYHEDSSKHWTGNDIYDMDSLSVAVPYADIVMADSASRNAVIRRGLDQVYKTEMPRRPADLLAIIDRKNREPTGS